MPSEPARNARPASVVLRSFRCMSWVLPVDAWNDGKRWRSSRHGSDVALLGGLLVARVDEAVGEDGDEQDDAAHEVLRRVGDVEDGHAVEQRADKQRADDDVEDAAAPAG